MAAVIGAAVTTAFFLRMRPAPVSPAAIARFAIHDSERYIVSRTEGDLALSPDGWTLAFVGYGEGGPRIWLRSLDSPDARSLPGTEGASVLGWSPDGRSLAFTADGRVKKVVVSGGTPEVVTSNRAQARSLAWGPGGTILAAMGNSFLSMQASAGTPPRLIARAYDEAHESVGFLPDGRHFLDSVRSADPAKAGTFVVALEGNARTRLLTFPAPARYTAGRLLFVRDRVLYAQALDLSHLRLTGDPVPLAENVAATFSVSNNGAAAYLPVSASSEQLLWMDRGGKVLDRVDQAQGATRPTLSPDGGRLAMSLRNDIWVLELARGVLSRLTSGGASGLTWSPDGQRLFFRRSAFRNRKDVIFEMPLGGAGKETIVREPDGEHAHVTDVTADGQYLIYEGEEEDRLDIWALRLTGDRKASVYIKTPNYATQGTLSPDGRWLAYTSDSSGRFEIHVQGFPEPGPRIQVSPNGGSSARWRRDGKELFYLAPDGMLMAVPVRSAQSIEFGKPAALFQFFTSQRGIPSVNGPYDVTADGQRFIVSAVVRRSDPSIQVLLNWPALVSPGAAR